MLSHLGLGLSAAVAQLLTNLDNFAIMLALLLTVGRWKVATGYGLAQILMLAAAMTVAEGTEAVPAWTGYLGLIPITLGLKGVWDQLRAADEPDQIPALANGASVVATTLLFLSLSVDSFAAMTALLADTLDQFRLSVLLGAAAAAAALGCLAMTLSGLSGVSPRWVRRLERLGPVAMILVGTYVLINSSTDLVAGNALF